ncbi:hypothetical protein [Dolichospermum sp. UHCC 0259]|uniref:hypothetical protein n=1 Tax=Dolichospermum sp. UHCC 0259 TaxID=2590010 RepID=UPI0014487724|nr:hypothetical protein [Dolichospermum sp. UHCC 0259]MTJ47569.1 hypothetical protein [Dolichospermum sp. UHCC 0259]
MSQPPVYQPNGYEAMVFFILLLAIGSAAFGYVVGKNDKDSYLDRQQQSQHIEHRETNSNDETPGKK